MRKRWRVRRGLYILAGNDGLEGWVDGGDTWVGMIVVSSSGGWKSEAFDEVR